MKAWAIGLTLWAWVSFVAARTTYLPAQALEQVNVAMQEQFPDNQPGAAIVVLQKDSILFAKGYGWADKLTQKPVTPRTNFCLASISKQFTAVAVLQLCEQGKMSLEDKVKKFFPNFTHSVWDKITVRHLLSHTSGIPDARNGYTRLERIYANDDRAVEFFPSVVKLRYEPGTAYAYLNPSFVLASKIVEKVSGEEFGAYMQKHVFRPAKMFNTRYFEFETLSATAEKVETREVPIPCMAHGYVKEGNGWKEYDFGEETFYATRADGALYSSVTDMAHWEMALQHGTLLLPKTIQQAWTPQISVSESSYSDYNGHPNTYYGLGWFIEPATATQAKVIYHTGENGGFHNIVARYPQKDVMVAILSTRPNWSQYDFLQRVEQILDL